MSTYNVRYELDKDGWWLAKVHDLTGTHTQGRTIDEARERILEALQLAVDDPNPQLLETVEVAQTTAVVNNVSVRRSSRRVVTYVAASTVANAGTPQSVSYSVGFPGQPELDQHVGLERTAASRA